MIKPQAINLLWVTSCSQDPFLGFTAFHREKSSPRAVLIRKWSFSTPRPRRCFDDYVGGCRGPAASPILPPNLADVLHVAPGAVDSLDHAPLQAPARRRRGLFSRRLHE